MNNTIFGRMQTDYSYMDGFSIVTYTESGKSYDDIYDSLIQIRQAGLDFSATINSSKNGRTGCLYVKNTLIFLKTADISRLREHLHGTMSIDYCTSIAYTLSPACVFNLAAGYAVNKIYCERDELLVGKILMKAGKSNGYIFVSPEIKEISTSDNTTIPILIVSTYGKLYKKSTIATKTHLNSSGLVVRGGNGIFLERLY